MSTKKMSIIYILSNGRSGSTILDMMLGSYPNLWTLGEAQLLPLELNFDAICGSGERIKESVFWKNILPRIRFSDDNISVSYFRKSNPNGSHTGAVLRIGLLKGILKGIFKENKSIQSYGSLNRDFFNEVKEYAEKGGFIKNIDWMIDASKDPYRLAWLQQSGLFDIKVIHLTKHPVSFIYSTAKNHQGGMNYYMTMRMTFRWIIENSVMNMVCKNFFSPKDVYHLHYEDLAADPQKALSNLGIFFGIDLSNYTSKQFREYINYGISGNKSRWENKQIMLDERWKKNVPNIIKKCIWGLTCRQAKIQGY